MNQAEKSQLRYIAIMEQSKNVMGDMARTIQTPANSLRILNEQINQLRRSLGNLLIPVLQKILPYIQAFVELITELIQKLAYLAGFELVEIDYSDLNNSLGDTTDQVGDLEDQLDNAASSAKNLKSNLLGIDELNVISEPYNSSGGSYGGLDDSIDSNIFDIEEFDYDFLDDLREKTDEIKESMRELAENIAPVIAALTALGALGWVAKKIGNLVGTIGKLKNLFTGNPSWPSSKNIDVNVKTNRDDFDSLISDIEGLPNIVSSTTEKVNENINGWISTISLELSNWIENVIEPMFSKDRFYSMSRRAYDGISDAFSDWNSGTWRSLINSWWIHSVKPWFEKERWSLIAKEAISALEEEFSKSNLEINIKLNIKNEYDVTGGGGRASGGGGGRRYATGGFPESGQLFFANEGSAPELIGNMGRRTAVANTSQIVEGITYGVENANAQQNALLREQNDLLRAILAKSGTVRIGNKDIKNAYDTASRQSGASIMSGGVLG